MSLRHRLIRCLPAALQRHLRAWNSTRQVRRFAADRWPEAVVVQRLIRPGDVVVDAGANIGYITALLAGWVGAHGLVHSIEPIPETFRLLQRSMRKLGLRQVQCHGCGVSDQPGQAMMEVPAYPDGAENFYESKVVTAAQARPGVRCLPVELRTLDQVVGDSLARVAFMKVDVEGHEEPALRGAQELLRRARPALLIEINSSVDEPDAPTRRVLDSLAALGYGLYQMGSGGLEPHRVGHRAVDYFFLTAEHLSARLAPLGQGERSTP